MTCQMGCISKYVFCKANNRLYEPMDGKEVLIVIFSFTNS
jgi:hypothetical protein